MEEFLNDKEKITGEDLGRLEREVIVALKAKRHNVTPGQSLERMADDKAAGGGMGGQQQQQQQQHQHQQQQQQQQQQPASGSSLVPPPPGSEWSVIAAYQELLSEEKARQDELTARMKKINFRQSLDEHIQKAKVLRAQTEDRTDKEYSEHVNKDVIVFHEQEKLKRAAVHEKHHAELMQRKQQIIDKAEKAREAKLVRGMVCLRMYVYVCDFSSAHFPPLTPACVLFVSPPPSTGPAAGRVPRLGPGGGQD